ncbi:unknown [Bacteroides sp. CAG:633]|nr:unknown [Bacteroides sp. CAG:633]
MVINIQHETAYDKKAGPDKNGILIIGDNNGKNRPQKKQDRQFDPGTVPYSTGRLPESCVYLCFARTFQATGHFFLRLETFFVKDFVIKQTESNKQANCSDPQLINRPKFFCHLSIQDKTEKSPAQQQTYKWSLRTVVDPQKTFFHACHNLVLL